jgi:hypothetical protein
MLAGIVIIATQHLEVEQKHDRDESSLTGNDNADLRGTINVLSQCHD